MLRLSALVMLLGLPLLVSCSKPSVKADAPARQALTTPQEGVETKTTRASREPEPTQKSNQEFAQEEARLRLDLKVWKLLSDRDGIQAYEKIDADDGIVAFRGEANIPADLAKIATIINTPALRKEWMDGLVESRVVERVSDFEIIEYNHTAVPWPFQDRDFVYRGLVKIKKSPPTMIIKTTSIEDARVPLNPKTVRGHILFSNTYLKQVEGVRSTKIIMEVAVDPKGVIPKWLVAASQRNWPSNTLLQLKKIAAREDIQVSPEVQHYFSNQSEKRGKKK